MDKTIKIVITVTGDYAEDLIAVGERDLKEFFLPKGKLKIPEEYLKSVRIIDIE